MIQLTVYGHVVRVRVGIAASLHFRTGGGVDGDGIRAEEAVHMAGILSWNHDRINVLSEGELGIDLMVGMGSARKGKERCEIDKHFRDWMTTN